MTANNRPQIKENYLGGNRIMKPGRYDKYIKRLQTKLALLLISGGLGIVAAIAIANNSPIYPHYALTTLISAIYALKF